MQPSGSCNSFVGRELVAVSRGFRCPLVAQVWTALLGLHLSRGMLTVLVPGCRGKLLSTCILLSLRCTVRVRCAEGLELFLQSMLERSKTLCYQPSKALHQLGINWETGFESSGLQWKSPLPGETERQLLKQGDLLRCFVILLRIESGGASYGFLLFLER